jgi:hypothetical protein
MSEDTLCSDRNSDVRRCVGQTIRWGDCDVLRFLLCVGLDINQSVQLYNRYKYMCRKFDVRPLLYRLIDEE